MCCQAGMKTKTCTKCSSMHFEGLTFLVKTKGYKNNYRVTVRLSSWLVGGVRERKHQSFVSHISSRWKSLKKLAHPPDFFGASKIEMFEIAQGKLIMI